MILESERRWDDWQGGQPIDLPDGQTWWFYEPDATVHDGMPGWSFGAETPELDRTLSCRFGLIVASWGKAADDADRAAAILDAAWFLLARNYDVSRSQFATLMLGASRWDRDRHERFASEVLALVGFACNHAAAAWESL